MKVIMPGSYDPVTVGHIEMIRRVAAIHDEVFVVCFINPEKEYMFPLQDRVAMLMIATEDMDNVIVSYSTGLVIDYMRDHGIDRIVKGYRTEEDLAWEKYQAEYNLTHGGYETDLIKCEEGMEQISSTVARADLLAGRDKPRGLSPEVAEYIRSLSRDNQVN